MEKDEFYQGDDIQFRIESDDIALIELDGITGFDSFDTIKVYPQTLTEIVELTGVRLLVTSTTITGTVVSAETEKMQGNLTFGIELIKDPSTTDDTELNIKRMLIPSTPIPIKTFRKPQS